MYMHIIGIAGVFLALGTAARSPYRCWKVSSRIRVVPQFLALVLWSFENPIAIRHPQSQTLEAHSA